jgi:hypothetical protein
LSSAAVTDPSLLRPEISLTRTIRTGPGDAVTKVADIRAVLRDERGTAVENSGIQVLVNGVPMRFVVATGNYYDRSPFYTLADATGDAVTPDTDYAFSLKLTDGRSVEIGRIRTRADLSPSEIDVPRRHSRRQPLALTWHRLEPNGSWYRWYLNWRGIPSSNDLVIRRMIEHAGGEPAADPATPPESDNIEIPIASGDGAFTVPASYFTPGRGRATATFVELTAKTRSRLGSPFKGGELVAVRETQFVIDLTD